MSTNIYKRTCQFFQKAIFNALVILLTQNAKSSEYFFQISRYPDFGILIQMKKSQMPNYRKADLNKIDDFNCVMKHQFYRINFTKKKSQCPRLKDHEIMNWIHAEWKKTTPNAFFQKMGGSIPDENLYIRQRQETDEEAINLQMKYQKKMDQIEEKLNQPKQLCRQWPGMSQVLKPLVYKNLKFIHHEGDYTQHLAEQWMKFVSKNPSKAFPNSKIFMTKQEKEENDFEQKAQVTRIMSLIKKNTEKLKYPELLDTKVIDRGDCFYLPKSFSTQIRLILERFVDLNKYIQEKPPAYIKIEPGKFNKRLVKVESGFVESRGVVECTLCNKIVKAKKYNDHFKSCKNDFKKQIKFPKNPYFPGTIAIGTKTTKNKIICLQCKAIQSCSHHTDTISKRIKGKQYDRNPHPDYRIDHKTQILGIQRFQKGQLYIQCPQAGEEGFCIEERAYCMNPIDPNPIETERTLNYHEAVFEEGVTYKCKSDQSLFVNQKVLFYDFSGFQIGCYVYGMRKSQGNIRLKMVSDFNGRKHSQTNLICTIDPIKKGTVFGKTCGDAIPIQLSSYFPEDDRGFTVSDNLKIVPHHYISPFFLINNSELQHANILPILGLQGQQYSLYFRALRDIEQNTILHCCSFASPVAIQKYLQNLEQQEKRRQSLIERQLREKKLEQRLGIKPPLEQSNPYTLLKPKKKKTKKYFSVVQDMGDEQIEQIDLDSEIIEQDLKKQKPEIDDDLIIEMIESQQKRKMAQDKFESDLKLFIESLPIDEQKTWKLARENAKKESILEQQYEQAVMTKDEKKKKSRLQKRLQEMRANQSIYERHPELRELEKQRRKRK